MEHDIGDAPPYLAYVIRKSFRWICLSAEEEKRVMMMQAVLCEKVGNGYGKCGEKGVRDQQQQ